MRPRRYVRAGEWLRILRVLATYGYPDHQIAEALQDLSDDALRDLARRDDLDDEMIHQAREDDAGRHWTRRMVQHHRRRLGLASRVSCVDGLRLLIWRIRMEKKAARRLLPLHEIPCRA